MKQNKYQMVEILDHLLELDDLLSAWKSHFFVDFVSVLVLLAFVPPFQLGDNCIQNFHMVRLSSDIRSEITDDIPPKMKILNKVIPMLMHFCSVTSIWSITDGVNLHVI